MEKRIVLEAEHLSKKYEDGVLALDRISFQVKEGEVFAMLGANGAGKTTCINLFLNFIEPTEGVARVLDIVTHKAPLEAKKQMAFVSENVMLYPNFTAMQNLDFFSRLGSDKKFSKAEYRQVLRRVGLQDAVHDKKLKDFSKGMRQKCGIAIAILKDAPAILLDEPTSGLDPKAGWEFIQLLDELRGEGKAIFMSTHDIFRAKEIADSVAIMKAGKMVDLRTRAELAGESLEEVYMEFMAGREEEVF